jgi:hypothetical protein
MAGLQLATQRQDFHPVDLHTVPYGNTFLTTTLCWEQPGHTSTEFTATMLRYDASSLAFLRLSIQRALV